MAVNYTVEYAKSGRSTCKKSKEKIPKDSVRIGKVTENPHKEGDIMMSWFLVDPFLDMMRRMRKDSKKVEGVEDLAGFDELRQEDQDNLRAKLRDFWDASVTIEPPKKKVKKAPAEDDEEAAGKKKKPKAKPKGAKPKKEPHPSEVVPCGDNQTVKALAEPLVAKARDDGIKLPTDDAVARLKAGAALMQAWDREAQTVDLGACLDTLEGNHGTTNGAKAVEVACEGNRALALVFKELAEFSFKVEQFKGITLRKVVKAICESAEEITSGKQALALPGIGKSSAARIDEFLKNKKIEVLEEFRRGEA